LLLKAGLAPVPAAVLVYFLGTTSTYLVNRGWSFAHDGRHMRLTPRYFAVYAAGAALQAVLLHVLLEYGRLDPMIAQVICIGVVAAFLFVALDRFVFSRGADRHVGSLKRG
jgi:putative flippase GtrA